MPTAECEPVPPPALAHPTTLPAPLTTAADQHQATFEATFEGRLRAQLLYQATVLEDPATATLNLPESAIRAAAALRNAAAFELQRASAATKRSVKRSATAAGQPAGEFLLHAARVRQARRGLPPEQL